MPVIPFSSRFNSIIAVRYIFARRQPAIEYNLLNIAIALINSCHRHSERFLVLANKQIWSETRKMVKGAIYFRQDNRRFLWVP